ncbi:FAD-binding oxidoreductase [Catenulispora sp. NF23]|uniref:FAD-binding oxidoreductase n=1 Tax=Catenulispora pinistramenti TaxID=2705254 RepID=A0ABS5KWY9_9ACTN|nr:FAD-binding oxidoreductase [Catenulispora pinistramenti]MBS2533942.1 FAD-binding oxidoreductase [Catenulispora pinistramenti]MBS2550563.1 FAD-binding oxidoreductase [Catenulispora pinistramenti]
MHILYPGDAGFDAEISGYNLGVAHHPRAVVTPRNSAEAAEAVRWAVSLDRPVAVQSTGHGIGVPADGAVLLNMRRMNRVLVDAERRTAWFEGGTRWRDVIAAATAFGLAPLCGTAPDVGAVGYHLGGGLPVLARTFGYAADHVRAFDLVTADGAERHVTPQTGPDLFWAVRGGKSNFGVVTAMEIDLFPLASVYAGRLVFPGALSATAFRVWRDWSRRMPETMNSTVSFVRFPDIEKLPPEKRGQYLFTVVVVWSGDPEAGAAAVRPLRDLGPAVDTVAEVPYARIGEVYADPTEPAAYVDAGGLIGELDDSAVEQVLAVAGPDALEPPFALQLRRLGGALERAPRHPGAIGHRTASDAVIAFGMAPDREAVPAVRARLDAALAVLKPALTGGTLPNFLGTADTAPDAVRAAYEAEDFARLISVKRAFDPGNVFRINHNIPAPVPAVRTDADQPAAL